MSLDPLRVGGQPEVRRADVVGGRPFSRSAAMREQLQAGLSMGMAGIPWWTS